MKKLFLKICLFTILIIFNISFNTGTGEAVRTKSVNDTLKSLNNVLDKLTEETFNELKVPGAIIGVYMGGYVPWIKTLGTGNLKDNKPIEPNDKMRIGSITKTFTGTVLLQLADEGKIKLQDKLSKYFPDFPNGDSITIEQAGNMTSGIFNYSEDEDFVKSFFRDMKQQFTPEELIQISLKHKPYFAPGKGFHYSNTNTVLLGLIIEKLTGNPLQTEIKNRIFIPLGMNESNFAVNTDFPDPHANGYIYLDSTQTEPTDVTVLNPSWGWSAGAIISTLSDVEKYAKKLATGGLISAESQRERIQWGTEMTAPSGPWKGTEMKYGFTIADFNGAIGHNGGIPGFNSFMGYYPEKDATIIVLVNMQDNKAGIGPADYIASVILKKIKEMKTE